MPLTLFLTRLLILSLLFVFVKDISDRFNCYALAAVFTTLFLGGWLGPSILLPELWFILKTFIVITAMILPRGLFPRIRLDMLLRRGWIDMMLLAFINLFISVLIVQFGIVTPGVVS